MAGGENQARAILTGALVGAQVGLSGIPRHFLDGLDEAETLKRFAMELASQVGASTGGTTSGPMKKWTEPQKRTTNGGAPNRRSALALFFRAHRGGKRRHSVAQARWCTRLQIAWGNRHITAGGPA